MIPMQRKKGASSNYTQGAPQTKHMGYTNSMSGQLQEKGGVLDQNSFVKSPLLNTGKKMSNTSLQRGYNRSSAPRVDQLNNAAGARTTTNWMHKQPPLSPNRNVRDMQNRLKQENEGLNLSQHSSYAGQQQLRSVHSPESLKIIDSSSDFGHSQMIGMRGASSHQRPGLPPNHAGEIRALKQYQQSRMPLADNEEPEIPQFTVSQQTAVRGQTHVRTTNASQVGGKVRSQLPNI